MRRHVCPGCKRERAARFFSPAKPGHGWIADDGSYHYSYCKDCNRRRVKAYYMASVERREARKQYMREYHARHKNDPDYIANRRAYERSERGRLNAQERRERYRARALASPEMLSAEREKRRLWAWDARRRMGAREIPKSGPKATDAEHDLRLPREPFAAWIVAKEKEYGGIATLADLTGLRERTLRRVRDGDGQDRVRLDTVDLALTNEGSTFLWTLYPDLYPALQDDEVAA